MSAPTTTATGPTTATGKRRVAFASYVDDNYLPGFLTLLRSLVLNNPRTCPDFVVLYDDLGPAAVSAIRRLYPRIVLRRVDPARYDDYVKGDQGSYLVRKAYFVLDVFRMSDYDTVIALDTDMVVLGDLGELLELREGIGAVEQFFPEGGAGRLNSGLLVVNREYLTGEFAARLDEVGRSGDYDVEKHDQGVLNAVLDGDFVRLDSRFNFVKRRLEGDLPVPDDVVVLHFTGRHKPWNGGEVGYERAEEVWRRYDLDDRELYRAFCALPGDKHPELVVHYGTRLVEECGADSATLLATGTALHSMGRYDEAVDVLLRVRDPKGVLDPRHNLALGRALMAVSRYDEAEARLLLATQDPAVAASAFGLLAECAWIRGDRQHQVAYARAGLDADPTDRKSGLLLRRARAEERRTAPGADPAEQLAHVAFYMDDQGNAGDKVLPESVRLVFDADASPRRWHSVHAHRLFDEPLLEEVNARRGLVIGGGGLFIPDTSPNGNSRWQWNVPDETLERITVPVVVFAVGYNVFDGQSYAHRRFVESLRLLVRGSVFFGLRNHGSIERVRALLPADLAERVVYQPCPTTVARNLVAGWQEPVERAETVLLNCAYDRSGLRFGHDYGHFLKEMADAVTALRERADVRYAAHIASDEKFVFDLRREHGISLPVVPMYDMSNAEIWAAYTDCRLVVGMRGHAGMIPFGCGTPIISLISHPKLAYFLDDIGRPDWGVSIHDRRLGAVLTERATAVLDDHRAMVDDVAKCQQKLWTITQNNLERLREPLGLAL
ncbi:polysaccharide pyruvyl transferase family protein [Thermobifida halotolerans]|uniref:Polysaccharide pyruvyl transferase family protein n=1 Tax=Thermobifida halotolerans TaxID=483545 RepID=A0A399G6C3_9ACTN|nr:glycosyltransferase [Thermobifida halotolerans]UOE18043.1 polysaccharide pyruvyl transferase family protein [Thermobifida halotolerans]